MAPPILRGPRPEFKAQAEYSLRAAQEASLGTAFDATLADLTAAIAGFDENLTDRTQATAGSTAAFHQARKAWLAFVDDTMKDYVTPKLRKLPVYANFRRFGKSKLAALDQEALLTESAALLKLYYNEQGDLKPGLGAEARTYYDADP